MGAEGIFFKDGLFYMLDYAGGFCWTVSSVGRALGLHPSGRQFKSVTVHETFVTAVRQKIPGQGRKFAAHLLSFGCGKRRIMQGSRPPRVP